MTIQVSASRPQAQVRSRTSTVLLSRRRGRSTPWCRPDQAQDRSHTSTILLSPPRSRRPRPLRSRPLNRRSSRARRRRPASSALLRPSARRGSVATTPSARAAAASSASAASRSGAAARAEHVPRYMYHDHGAGHNFMMMMITTLPVPHRSRPAKIRWLIHSESVWNSAGKCATRVLLNTTH